MGIFFTRDVAIFYRQLANLFASGVPVIEALAALSQYPNRVQAIAMSIKSDVSGGLSLAEAFARTPKLFPAWHVEIIRYSEKAGHLAEDLGALATYLEKEYAAFLGIIVRLAYPIILLHIAFLLLPLVSLSACGGGGYIGRFLGLVLPVYITGFLLLAARYFLKRSRFKNIYDQILVSIPLIGVLARRLVLARFIRGLQCLSSAGVPIVSAWDMAAAACGNNFIEAVLRNVTGLIKQGEPISKALVQTRLFSPQTITMVVTAEKSGALTAMLTTINSYYEKETDAAMGVITSIIPVVVYLLIAGFIALRVIGFYSSYFQRLGNF